MTVDIADLALKERVCDATDRIPTNAWPVFSTTLRAVIVAGGTTAQLTFEAERDTLLTDLSIAVAEDDDIAVPATLDIEYCNIQYAEDTLVAEWAYCCDRKPIFLMGVRENKKLRFNVSLVAPTDEDVNVEVTISGFQGHGCCS